VTDISYEFLNVAVTNQLFALRSGTAHATSRNILQMALSVQPATLLSLTGGFQIVENLGILHEM
jgi:hypothetical protein